MLDTNAFPALIMDLHFTVKIWYFIFDQFSIPINQDLSWRFSYLLIMLCCLCSSALRNMTYEYLLFCINYFQDLEIYMIYKVCLVSYRSIYFYSIFTDFVINISTILAIYPPSDMQFFHLLSLSLASFSLASQKSIQNYLLAPHKTNVSECGSEGLWSHILKVSFT